MKGSREIVPLGSKVAKNSSNWRELSNFGSVFTALSSKVEKTRQIEGKSRNCPSRFKSRKKLVKLARIVEFWVSSYCSKFKSRKNSPNGKEVENFPWLKLSEEFTRKTTSNSGSCCPTSSLWLVFLSLSRFFRSNAKKNLVKLLILYLAHKNIFCLHFFIATVDVCLLLSSEGAPKKLKATTITKLKKLKIGFLTTLSSECIWQHCFFFRILQWIPEEFFDVFTIFFQLLLPTKMSFVKRFFILTNCFEFYTAYEYFICTNCQKPKFDFCTPFILTNFGIFHIFKKS